MNSIIASAVLPAIEQVAISLSLVIGALLSVVLGVFGVAKVLAIFSPTVENGLKRLIAELTDTVRERAGFDKDLDLPKIGYLPSSVRSTTIDQFSDVESSSALNDLPIIEYPELDSFDDPREFSDTFSMQDFQDTYSLTEGR
jgi:hypothetical protein